MRVAIAGGNGFIGRELTSELLARGDEVVWLSHTPGKHTPHAGVEEFEFDPANPSGAWAEAARSADGVVNLSGSPLATRWNEQIKREIVTSRVATGRALVNAIGAHRTLAQPGPPCVFVTASGIGIYGDRGDELLDEASEPGDDWLSQLAASWEREARRAEEYGCRFVAIRTGLVLGDEGLVPRLMLPMKLFVGGPIGTGRQWAPWIHYSDIVGLYAEALHNPRMRGPFNGVAPGPVRMREFMKAFGRSLRRPSWLPVPDFALRIVLGEVAPYTLYSQRATADKALLHGYRFRFEDIDAALEDVVA